MSDGAFKMLAFPLAEPQENSRVGGRRLELGFFLATGLGWVSLHSSSQQGASALHRQRPGDRSQCMLGELINQGMAVSKRQTAKLTRNAPTLASRVGRVSSRERVKTGRH